MLKGIIFDLDGTLLNTIDDLNNSINDTFKYFNLDRKNTTSLTMSQVGHGMRNFIEKCFPCEDEKFIDEALKVFLNCYGKQYYKTTKPYTGIKELVDYLISNDYLVGVNSNKNEEYTKHLIELNFPDINEEYVKGIKAGDKPKPDPKNINDLIYKMNLKNEEILYIGDSPTDYKTSINAKVNFVGVTWGYRSREQLSNAGIKYLADNCEDIKEIIKKFGQSS